MIKIAPSVLSADFAHLARDLQAVESADYLHVDIMDGVFVPNLSIGFPVVEAIRKATALPLDVHLMMVQPLRYVERFCAVRILFPCMWRRTRRGISTPPLTGFTRRGKRREL